MIAKDEKASRQANLRQHIEQHDEEANPSGQTLSEKTRHYRFEVCEQWLKQGLSFELFDDAEFRALMESGGNSLGSSRTMRDIIPSVLDKEIKRLIKYLTGKDVSVSSTRSPLLARHVPTQLALLR